MKKIFLSVILLISFSSCGRDDQPENSRVSLSRSASESLLSHFENTLNYPEVELLKIFSVALSSGVTLNSAKAERCWREETNRPIVQESCLMLWAGGGESNPVLDSALDSQSSKSRRLAIASVMRKSTIQRMSFGSLLELLSTLQSDPLWLRTAAASIWVESNGSQGYEITKSLLPLVTASGSASARDTAASLKLLFRLRPGSWHSSISTYCDTAVKGESRMRCWRMIGMLADNSVEPAMILSLSHFLPDLQSSDWSIFKRSFPELANRIQTNIFKENK